MHADISIVTCLTLRSRIVACPDVLVDECKDLAILDLTEAGRQPMA